MKKCAASFFGFIITCTIVLSVHAGLQAARAAEGDGASFDPIAEFHDILGDEKKTGLSTFDNRIHKLSSDEPGADIITSVIFTALDFLKYLLGSVAVIFVIVSGAKLIMSGKKIDEVSEKEKETIKMIMYGLILIITADELVTKVFFGDYDGECLKSASNAKDCAKAGSSLVKGIYSLVLSLMASLAVLVLVLSGFRMVTAQGNEEEITKQRKRILAAIAGLFIAGTGEFVVKKIVFQDGGTKGINVRAANELVLKFTSFIASFIGIGAFVMFFYAGYLYVTAAGNEEQTGKAKKIMLSSVIGIVVAVAAYGIVTAFTSLVGRPPTP